MFVKSTEKFLEAFEKKYLLKNEVLSEYSNHILSFIFSKSKLFSLFLTYNLIGVWCGHAFLYWRKDLSSAKFSDTSNMFAQSTEKFLEPFLKSFFSKKEEEVKLKCG